MEQKNELKFPLAIAISFFFHLLIPAVFLTAGLSLNNEKNRLTGSGDQFTTRDILVNINQNDIQDVKRTTMLSDKDSKAQGRLSEQHGDTWLNNSTEYLVKGRKVQAGGSKTEEIVKTDLFSINVMRTTSDAMSQNPFSSAYASGNSDFTRIPDLKGINRQNAIYFSNDGKFSFNTMKFKNFEYFRKMKNKIASNWYAPQVPNAILNAPSGPYASYTPGMVRMRMIPSQDVKLYFTMNRRGDVLDVVIVESLGNKYLNDSCVDSIKLSKSFGTVPADIEGQIVIIPFIFGYYTD